MVCCIAAIGRKKGILYMKIRYSYTYERYPNCYEATCYSKRRSDEASRLAMLGFFVLLLGLWGIIDIFTTGFAEKQILRTIFDVLAISFCVFYFYYLLVLRNIITENEIAIIFTRADYGWDIPVEIYERIENMRLNNKKVLIKKTLKFSAVYISVLTVILFAGWFILKIK